MNALHTKRTSTTSNGTSYFQFRSNQVRGRGGTGDAPRAGDGADVIVVAKLPDVSYTKMATVPILCRALMRRRRRRAGPETRPALPANHLARCEPRLRRREDEFRARIGHAKTVAFDITVRNAAGLREAYGEIATFIARPGQARCEQGRLHSAATECG
jgi:hypothetical protein